MSRFLPASLFLLASLLPSWGAAQPKPASVQIAPDRQLEVLQVGEGQATVIFESGFSMAWSTWRRVLPDLATQARLIAYSRAGTGTSVAVNGAPTVADRVADLEALIRVAALKPPFVLVGHSYGGLVVRQFASKHPQQVQGLVLVDPASERMTAALRALDAPRAAREDATAVARAPQRFKAEYAHILEQLDRGIDPELGPLPAVPVALLTSIKPEWPDLLAFSAEGREAWRQAHAHWFAQVRSGSHVITEASGHFIQNEEPELVVQAVQSVIQRAQAQAERLAQVQRRERLQAGLAALQPLDTGLSAKVDALLLESRLGEADINRLGYQLLGAKQQALALAVLAHNAQRFASSVNAQDSHGEALLASGDAAAALSRFDAALALLSAQPSSSPAQRTAVEANRRKAQAALSPSATTP
jgi:pimeloyl-ACP methyl ester carboxylesterase